MKESIKSIVMGLLIWSCIIWVVCFDPSQFGQWLKIAIHLGVITWLWWWVCDFVNPFVESKDNEEEV